MSSTAAARRLLEGQGLLQVPDALIQLLRRQIEIEPPQIGGIYLENSCWPNSSPRVSSTETSLRWSWLRRDAIPAGRSGAAADGDLLADHQKVGQVGGDVEQVVAWPGGQRP